MVVVKIVDCSKQYLPSRDSSRARKTKLETKNKYKKISKEMNKISKKDKNENFYWT